MDPLFSKGRPRQQNQSRPWGRFRFCYTGPMQIPESIRNWTPTKQSAGFLWNAGGWLVIGLIVSNTLLGLYTATIQLQTLSIASSDGSSVRSMQRAMESEVGMSFVERRQLLAAAKIFVLVQDAPDVEFTLIFIKRIGSWALLEVIPETEGIAVTRLLMEKDSKGTGEWTGRAMGSAIDAWEDRIPDRLTQ